MEKRYATTVKANIIQDIWMYFMYSPALIMEACAKACYLKTVNKHNPVLEDSFSNKKEAG